MPILKPHFVTPARLLLWACVLTGFLVDARTHSVLASEPANYAIVDAKAGPQVLRNGKLVTQYLTLNGHKPVLYPIMGPDSVEMTRAYPIATTKDGEREDHIHHRSLWFTHGEVNGVDFWAEGESCGRIVQTAIRTSSAEDGVSIRTENQWQDPAGDVVLTDVRELFFHDVGAARVIDFDVILKASEGDVVFGDTKEGSFGIRVAGTMKVDADPGGTYVSDSGLRDAKAWGKEAAWIDYTGPIDGRTYGIAILNHPTSYGYPTRWHARTYGLFAANPFGTHHFVGGAKTDGVLLKQGESLTLRYRVVLHAGTTEEAGIAAQWKKYADTP